MLRSMFTMAASDQEGSKLAVLLRVIPAEEVTGLHTCAS